MKCCLPTCLNPKILLCRARRRGGAPGLHRPQRAAGVAAGAVHPQQQGHPQPGARAGAAATPELLWHAKLYCIMLPTEGLATATVNVAVIDTARRHRRIVRSKAPMCSLIGG